MTERMEKLCRMLEEKISDHAERGLTTGNIDLMCKLVDIYKDIKNTEYWEIKAEYYLEQMEDGYSGDYPVDHSDDRDRDGGYSGARRKRDSRGRYSREGGYSYDGGPGVKGVHGGHGRGSEMHERYIDAKHSYRSSGGSDCKQRLVKTLDEYMDNFSQQMEEMLRDADCAEERDTIHRYLNKLRNLS